MSAKLVGRDAERRALKEALDDPSVRIVTIGGPSGAGKTTLVEDALARLRESGAIVGCGKYADGSATGAFGPALAALSEATNGALELLYDPVAGANALRDAMQPQLALLASAGLHVPGITPAALDPAFDLVGRGGPARIIEAALRLLRWLDGFGVPVVLFIDDWHRAPREAQGLLSAIARDDQRCSLILAERKATSRTPLPEAAICQITLGPLSETARKALLEMAAAKPGAGAAIAQWLSAGFSGLPFDLIQAAHALNDCDALVQRGRAWTVDQARAASIDRADFNDALVRRLRLFPDEVREAGAAIALWGDTAPLGLVAEALGKPLSELLSASHELERIGLVGREGDTVRVLHDRLRAALLDASEASVRIRLAAEMSERMGRWPTEAWNAVARTGLYLRLEGGLADAQPADWRDRFAYGAMAARLTADSDTATDFAEASWQLRARQRPEHPEAEWLILREALFSAAQRHDREAMRERAAALLAAATDEARKSEAYGTAILAARLVGESELAWGWVVEGFRGLGIRLPDKIQPRDLIWPVLRWRLALALGRPVDIAKITPSPDPLIKLANIGSLIAFERTPLQAMLIALKVTTHARRRGYSDPVWLATDTFISASLGDHVRAARLGTLAASQAQRSAFSPATTLYRALYFGAIWSRPLQSLFAESETIYQWSMAEGDIVNAAVTVRNDALLAWRLAPTLDELLTRLAEDERRAERLADDAAIQAVREFAHYAGLLKQPGGLAGNTDYAPDGVAMTGTPVARVEMLSLRGDWPAIVAYTEALSGMRPALNSHPGGVIWRFHETLARLRMGLKPRKGDLDFIRRAAKLNPVDHHAKLLLLEAEFARAEGNREKSKEAYALALDFAAKAPFRLEEGLIAEFAAFGSRLLGDFDNAARYAKHAERVWRAWGAAAKLDAASPAAVSGEAAARLAEAETQAAVAARSERAKSRFLAEVAHELRTPLQGMQGLVELAAEGKEKVDMMELRDVLGSLRNVVDDLTELEALGAGAPLNLQVTDVAQLLEGEGAVFAALARQKGLSFRTAVDASAAGHFLVDASRLRQIVRNLLSNAVKYSDRGGIALRASGEAQADDEAHLFITVEDNGPGISEADLPRLFEPFERGGREGGGGLGLGLALSRRIAERMLGTLTVENVAPRGVRFTLEFTAEGRAAEERAAATSMPALRLLLVEDVPLSRRMIATLLRRDGHDVREAGGGYEALEICKNERLDLVFLDLGLPDMDGMDVLHRLREAGSTVPVVVLTASALPTMKERALEAGAAATLRKPASGDELRATITDVLNRPHAPEADMEAEFALLREEARREIATMAEEIVEHASSMDNAAIRVKAHRLAGLAAQFQADEVAESADRLEAAAAAGEGLPPALAGMATALLRFRTKQRVASGE